LFSYVFSGKERVSVSGLGHDKAQITSTIFAAEAGHVLNTQMIFGGKTDRSLPVQGKQDSTDGIIYVIMRACLRDHLYAEFET